MTYDDLITDITDSTPGQWLYHINEEIFIYKGDLNIRLQERKLDEDDQDFSNEDWVKNPAFHGFARKVQYDLYYGASLVEIYYFISVDKGSAILPYPESHVELSITPYQYKVGQIINVNRGGRLDEYIRRGGLRVE